MSEKPEHMSEGNVWFSDRRCLGEVVGLSPRGVTKHRFWPYLICQNSVRADKTEKRPKRPSYTTQTGSLNWLVSFDPQISQRWI